MDTKLKGKTAIVTGAAAGIGFATVELLLAEGANVIGGDLRPDALTALGEAVVPVVADLATEEGSKALVDVAVEKFGGVDIVVNNVGTFPYREGFLTTTIDQWRQSFEINFLSAVRLTRLALPHMIERGSGSIVTVASECGRQPDVFFVDYSVTKAALINLSKSWANEFGRKGIRSNIVSPGPTRSAQWDAPGGFGESLAAEYNMSKEEAIVHFAQEVRKLPVGHIGAPEDVAAAIVFLSSDLAKQVTGAEYTVNGGSYIAA
ncbi:SDR family oxidoreductase [Rhodococcus sp. ABRD24]|uniref:SDR family NAD(P)-dependent oxidoreductase n=1 Tax=Rhodococcus sp. ABRD24 TaxID=2507582 RepID=UPI00103AC4A4|nr:SDR family oxidoreductase [Rhodococcus sp. ABRD24]QBJ96602.1 SDR family oxidoreductase [Rhodococcus sp. ABRD24]